MAHSTIGLASVLLVAALAFGQDGREELIRRRHFVWKEDAKQLRFKDGTTRIVERRKVNRRQWKRRPTDGEASGAPSRAPSLEPSVGPSASVVPITFTGAPTSESPTVDLATSPACSD